MTCYNRLVKRIIIKDVNKCSCLLFYLILVDLFKRDKCKKKEKNKKIVVEIQNKK